MACTSQMQAFGYALHPQELRGKPVPLVGVPSISHDAHLLMQQYSDMEELPASLARHTDEAIEAACWVIINRRLAQRSKEPMIIVPQFDEEDDW